MESKIYSKLLLVFILAGTVTSSALWAQNQAADVKQAILHNDSLFWKGYNSCDTAICSEFITRDVEFYHDKGGITLGAEALLLSIKNNLCGNDDFRIRREAVTGTVKVYPLMKGNVSYGAVLSGEHVFYIYGKNKKEQLDGRANFTHLWILKEGKWKMTRILSFNHHAAE
jgi:hypothetical protein